MRYFDAVIFGNSFAWNHTIGANQTNLFDWKEATTRAIIGNGNVQIVGAITYFWWLLTKANIQPDKFTFSMCEGWNLVTFVNKGIT